MTTYVPIPTRQALFATCAVSPEEDTPRLVLADYLEESGTKRVKCPHCAYDGCVQWGQKCKECGGAADIIDTSDADLAEVIRTGVALTRPWGCRGCQWQNPKHPGGSPYPYCHEGCDDCDRHSGFFARERELLAAHPEWLAELRMPCPGCGGSGTCVPYGSQSPCPTCGGTGDLLKRASSHNICPGCQGRGGWEDPEEGQWVTCNCAVNMRSLTARNPTLTRGITLSVECELGEMMREVKCRKCKGTGGKWHQYRGNVWVRCGSCTDGRVWQLTPWARAYWGACVGMERVPEVRVTGRVPYHNAADCWLWSSFRNTIGLSNGSLTVLPLPLFDLLTDDIDIQNRLFDLLTDDIDIQNRSVWRTYRTHALALAALNRAVNQWARVEFAKK